MKQTLSISITSLLMCILGILLNINFLLATTEAQKDIIVSFNTETKRYDTPECISKKWCKNNCIQITLEEARKRGGIPYLTCQNSTTTPAESEIKKEIKPSPIRNEKDTAPQQNTTKSKQGAFDILSSNNSYTFAIFNSDWEGQLISPEDVSFPISMKKADQQYLFSIDKQKFVLKDLVIKNNKDLSFSIKFNNNDDLKLSFSGTISDKEISGNVIDAKGKTGTWKITPADQKRTSSAPKRVVTFQSTPLNYEELPSCLSIDFEEYPLKSSRLKGNFDGYTCSITSRCKDNVRIMTADIPNGFSGSQAVKSTKGDARLSYYIWGGVGYAITKGRNNSASKESAFFENSLPKGILTTGNMVKTKTLIQKSEKPELNLIIKNLNDNKIYSINQ